MLLQPGVITKGVIARGATGGNSGIQNYYFDGAFQSAYVTDNAAANPYLANGDVNYGRHPIGNRNVLPYTNSSSSANHVRHSLIKFRVASNANYSNVRVSFVNWGMNSTSEFVNNGAIRIKASVWYNNSFYPITFNSGCAEVTITNNREAESDDVSGLTLTAGTEGYIITRYIGPSGSRARYQQMGTHVIHGEGTLASAVETDDYTTGTFARSAVAGTPVLSGGNITSCPVTSGGSGWTSVSAPSVYAYEVQADGQIANKTIGYANKSGDAISTITVTSGTPPAGATWTNPTVVIGNQFSSTTLVYGPSLISGVPDRPVKSLILLGDSITIGWSSSDTIGDIKHNFGLYERGLNNVCGVINLGSSGISAQYYQSFSLYGNTWRFIRNNPTTYGLVALGTNDLNAGTNYASTKTYVEAVTSRLRLYGRAVGMAYLLPRSTSTDAFATEVNQTPATGFGAGSGADSFNTAIANGSIVSEFSPIDGRFLVQGTDPWKWRADSFSAWTPPYTGDGTHPALNMLGYATSNSAWKNQFSNLFA